MSYINLSLRIQDVPMFANPCEQLCPVFKELAKLLSTLIEDTHWVTR